VTDEAAETMLVSEEGVAKLGVAEKARALIRTNKSLFMCKTLKSEDIYIVTFTFDHPQ